MSDGSTPPRPAADDAAPTGDAPGGSDGRHDQRRAQLLRVGAELFAARGYDEVPIEEIAATAGTSRGLLYHYFPSKQAFHLAVVEHTLAEVRGLLAPAPDLPPVRALTDVLHRFFAYIGDHEVGVLTLARGEAGSGARLQALLDAFRNDTVDQVLAALHDLGLADPSAELRVALRGWAGAVEGLALGWLAHGDPRSETQRGRLVELAGALLASCLSHVGVPVPTDDP